MTNFKDIPTDILLQILFLLPRNIAYKFFLINKECYHLNKKYHAKSLYWANRTKFYGLVKITCCWKNNYDLNKIQEDYKYCEDFYNIYNNKYIERKLKNKKTTNRYRMGKTFSQYFIKYLEIYDKNPGNLLNHMEKYYNNY